MGKESAHETVALNPDPKPDSLISTNIHAENDAIIGKCISMSENDHLPSLQSASELAGVAPPESAGVVDCLNLLPYYEYIHLFHPLGPLSK